MSETNDFVIGSTTGKVWKLMLRSIIWLLVFLLPTAAIAQDATDTPDGGLPRSESGQVLFVRDGNLYVIDGDGSNERQVTTDLVVGIAAWMPDGNQIVFWGDTGFFLMQADGSNAQRLMMSSSVSGRIVLLHPSPDGTRLLFGGGTGIHSNRAYYSVNIATGEAQLILDNITIEPSLLWSPDSSQILYHFHTSVYLIDANSGEQRYIAEGKAAWSPDGTSLVIVHYNMNSAMSTFDIVRVDGTETRQLTEHSGSASTVEWSPDGRKIAWLMTRLIIGGELLSDIRTIDVDSGEVHIITPPYLRGYFAAMAWSPDSQQLVFEAREVDYAARAYVFHLYVARANEQNLSQLTEVTAFNSSFGWRP